MTRIDSTMIAEIGTWQDFPPRSGLRRTLAALAGHYGAWISLSRQRRALADLDDHLLRDIGADAATTVEAGEGAIEAVLAMKPNYFLGFLFGFALAACSAMKRGRAKAATCTSGDQYLVLNLPALA